MSFETDIRNAINRLYDDRGAAYTAGFLTAHLIDLINTLPAAQQSAAAASLVRVVDHTVKPADNGPAAHTQA